MDPGVSTSTTFRDINQSYDERPIYGMPPILDSSVPTVENFSPLKDLLQSMLSLLQDKYSLGELFKMVGKCTHEPSKNVTETKKYFKTLLWPEAQKENLAI